MSDLQRFPNETVATILEDSAADLLNGERSYAEVRSILVCLLMMDSGVVQRDDTLGPAGRLSFGRQNAGDGGIGLWIPGEAFDGDFDDLAESTL